MINLFCLALVLLWALTGASNGEGGKLIQVAPGSDVSASCEDSESGWSPLSNNSVELKLDKTAHLLVQNFQKQQDQGLYRCGSKEVFLDEMPESKADTTLLYRAEGQSVHLFCKYRVTRLCNGSWSGISHGGSGSPPVSGAVDGGQHNNFSHHIASVKWGDAGMLLCEMRCWGTVKRTSYELIVVNATVVPQHVFIGESVTLCCRVSQWKTPGQVCWVKLHPYNNNRRYHGHQERCWLESQPSFCHQVVNMKPGDTSWACAVFYNNTLRALVPFQVNVSNHTTTSEPTTHSAVMDAHTCLMMVLGLVVLILVILTAVLLLCNKRRKDVAMTEEERGDEHVGDEGAVSRSDSVTYTAVNFKKKSPEDPDKGNALTEPLNGETGDLEDDTVIYGGLKMNYQTSPVHLTS